MAIDREKYRSKPNESKPKLTADMIPAPKTVLTFRDVNEVNGPGGPTLAITFAEFPDHTYWTNKTQQDALLDAVDSQLLPDDFKKWSGKRVPIYKKQNENPESGEKVWKLYAVPVELWQDALDGFDRAVAAARTPAARTPATRR